MSELSGTTHTVTISNMQLVTAIMALRRYAAFCDGQLTQNLGLLDLNGGNPEVQAELRDNIVWWRAQRDDARATAEAIEGTDRIEVER